ncbi:MAG: hypothetical protein QM802_20865 [Agriterribacter sp.]
MNDDNRIKEKIKVDFRQDYVPIQVKIWRPEVYKQGRLYYCVLQYDNKPSAIAQGRTALEAMENWELNFGHKLKQ